MKKLFALGLILTLLSAAAIAQGPGDRYRRHNIRQGFRSGELTRLERMELRKDQFRLESMERRARRDGRVTPYERRKLHKMRAHTRREAFRFKHNNRRRVL
jgi:hypothetical protein